VAALTDHDSSSNISKLESLLQLELPELPESPRWSTLGSAAKGAKKKAAQQAEEDNKTETEDEGWGGNVLDVMVDQLGMRTEVEKDIRDHHWKQYFAQHLANFSHAYEDGNAVMMTTNATGGFGALSRDANYAENVRLLVHGGGEKGFCAVPNALIGKWSCCTSVLSAIDSCTSSAPWRMIWQEKMIASTALIIATQASGFIVCCIQTQVYLN
jgi:hypothetical protein